MDSVRWMVLLLAVLAGAAVWAAPAASPVGVWKLVSYTALDPDTRETLYPFGKSATGFIHYTAGGRMAVLLQAGDRKPFSGGNRINAPVEERAEAFSTSTSYAGRYTYDAAKKQMIHHVEVSTNPDWVGKDQLRFPVIEGNRLTLSTPPLPTRPDGKLRVSTLVWERVE